MKNAIAGFDRLNGRAALWLVRIASVVLALLAILTFCDVAGRYFFNKPFSFTVELTELGMGLLVYFGVGLMTHEKGNVSVDFVTIRLPERIRAMFEFVTSIAAFAFLCFVVWQLFLRAQILFDKSDHTPILFFPLWPVAFLMAAASILFLTGTLLQAASALMRIAAPRDPA